MRFLIIFALSVFCRLLASADVLWHDFGKSERPTNTIAIGHASITIETLADTNSAFPGDDLMMTVRMLGQKPCDYYFSSSYGYGSVAVYGNFVLLKYGVGRGTFARVDHVKALRLDHELDELVDVQSSYYVLANSHEAAGDLVEYRVKMRTKGGYTTLSFYLPTRHHGLSSEKIVRFKNDGQ